MKRISSFRLGTFSTGQAAVEYAVGLCFVVVILSTVPRAVLNALSVHFQEIVTLFLLPIP